MMEQAARSSNTTLHQINQSINHQSIIVINQIKSILLLDDDDYYYLLSLTRTNVELSRVDVQQVVVE